MSAITQLVAKYLLADNLPAAERICRLELGRDGGDRGAALLGLAIIARTLQRHAHERLCFEALENPYRDRMPPLDCLADLTFSTPGNGILSVEARGCGFWSEAFNALGGVLLAWLMGKTPRINWGEGFLFSDDPATSAFEHFFEPVTAPEEVQQVDSAEDAAVATTSNAAALRSVARNITCRQYVSPIEVLYWIIPALDIGEGEIKNHLAAALHRILRPRQAIVEAVDAYVDATFGGAPYCAFHLRGTDKGSENPNAAVAVLDIIERVGRLDRGLRLYLLSDDAELAAAMVDRFGDRLSLQPFARSRGQIGVHDPRCRNISRELLGREVLIDTLVAARAARFIGSGQSNVGAAVDLIMHRTPARGCELVDTNHMLEYRHWGTVQW